MASSEFFVTIQWISGRIFLGSTGFSVKCFEKPWKSNRSFLLRLDIKIIPAIFTEILAAFHKTV